MKIGKYPIPWEGGQPLGTAPRSRKGQKRTIEWRENIPFTTTITFDRLWRGQSSFRAKFTDANGLRYQMFSSDFEKAIPYMEYGQITGKFCFVKRGNYFGIRLIVGNPLEMIAQAAEEEDV